MHSPAVLENYTLVSTQVPWTYTQALMDFKVGGFVADRRTGYSHCVSVSMNEPSLHLTRSSSAEKGTRSSCPALKLRFHFRITVF